MKMFSDRADLLLSRVRGEWPPGVYAFVDTTFGPAHCCG
jgi:hypothetical protein